MLKVLVVVGVRGSGGLFCVCLLKVLHFLDVSRDAWNILCKCWSIWCGCHAFSSSCLQNRYNHDDTPWHWQCTQSVLEPEKKLKNPARTTAVQFSSAPSLYLKWTNTLMLCLRILQNYHKIVDVLCLICWFGWLTMHIFMIKNLLNCLYSISVLSLSFLKLGLISAQHITPVSLWALLCSTGANCVQYADCFFYLAPNFCSSSARPWTWAF